MPSIFEKLREAQRLAGLTPQRPDDDTASFPVPVRPDVVTPISRCDGDHGMPYCADPECWQREEVKVLDDAAGVGDLDGPQHFDYQVLPKQVPSQKLGTSHAGKGYLRIFPATFRTIADVPKEWQEKNWSGPSAWCRIEGEPDHPDFEANLTAFENAP